MVLRGYFRFQSLFTLSMMQPSTSRNHTIDIQYMQLYTSACTEEVHTLTIQACKLLSKWIYIGMATWYP